MDSRFRVLGGLLGMALSLGCATADQPLQAGSGLWAVVQEEGVVYARPDGEALEGDLYRPVGVQDAPGLLLVHGGAWHWGRRAEFHRAAMRLARNGYVVLSVDYRTAPRWEYPAPVCDLQAALGWLQEHRQELGLDPERMGAWGYSAGAHLVALTAFSEAWEAPAGTAGCDVPDAPRLRAVVAGGIPSDLLAFDNFVVRSFMGGSAEERPDAYTEASPAFRVVPDAPPFLVYHGRSDRVVPWEQSQRMLQALQAAGVPHEFHPRPGGHIDTFYDDSEITRIALEFLDRWL